MTSEKQVAANRANSQKSTGPVTPEGKATSSHNAVRTALTGQTILLKTDDVTAYECLIDRLIEEFRPDDDKERALAQDLADTEWRLARIAPLEAGILAMGRMQLEAEVASIEDLNTRAEILEAKVATAYAKDLRNLTLQQTRLNRHRTAVTAEIKELQTERKEVTRHQAMSAAKYYMEAVKKQWEINLNDFGFEFALDDMLQAVAYIRCLEERPNRPEFRKTVLLKEARAEYAKLYGER